MKNRKTFKVIFWLLTVPTLFAIFYLLIFSFLKGEVEHELVSNFSTDSLIFSITLLISGSWIFTQILFFVLTILNNNDDFWKSLDDLKEERKRIEELGDKYIMARGKYLKEFEKLKILESSDDNTNKIK